MDHNQLEKEKIFEWSVKQSNEGVKQKYFSQKNASMDSYFSMKEGTDYLTPYRFETLPELQEQLQILWKHDEEKESIEKVLLIAAMKNKPENIGSKDEDTNKNEEHLPQYIYNF